MKKSEQELKDSGEGWAFWFSTNAFSTDKQLRRLFRILPHDPRCKFCSAPFGGVGGSVVKAVFGKARSTLNPNFCNMCEEAARKFPGGAEVEMSILFTDIRGSTALSEKMTAAEFGGLINRFYTEVTQIISASDGLVEKLAGDAVAAFWGAGFAGPEYAHRTWEAAQKIAQKMALLDIPVGTGVHWGVAYFGAMGTSDGLTNITAIGEEVNTAARLASSAAAGEVIASEQALEAAGVDYSGLEPRRLELKGISEPVPVRVLRVSSLPEKGTGSP